MTNLCVANESFSYRGITECCVVANKIDLQNCSASIKLKKIYETRNSSDINDYSSLMIKM